MATFDDCGLYINTLLKAYDKVLLNLGGGELPYHIILHNDNSRLKASIVMLQAPWEFCKELMPVFIHPRDEFV